MWTIGQAALVAMIALALGAWLAGDTPATAQDPVVGVSSTAGAVVPFSGNGSAPSGYLLADGSSVSRSSYPALFAAICPGNPAGSVAIGTVTCPHGTADSSTFRLPDLRGRVVAGRDNMGNVTETPANRLTVAGSGIAGSTRGASGGVESVTVSVAQMPVHNHGIIDNGHGHAVRGSPDGNHAGGGGGAGGGWGADRNDGWNNNIHHLYTRHGGTGIWMHATGSSQAHSNIAPTLITHYIIKT